ncbi:MULTISPECIES: hypothetical protein [unclassified Paludibacterium]|uniref:hypothetical protein n=1 Tax=unclassified Paludibacterium TaxID=2618429 RepID=UPI001C05D949|nr:hypothetical protein [Paludibacterium sp. B53371]BEV70930.1 hypothetical protein THUN1379_04120 [Paludibacterium sp. THUN1379]
MLEGCCQRTLAACQDADYVGALAGLQCLCLFCPDKPKVLMVQGRVLQSLSAPVPPGREPQGPTSGS